MGKSQRKQHQGRKPPRRHMPNSMPECTESSEPFDPTVICPHCLNKAAASQHQTDRFGQPGVFVCPTCRARIEPQDYAAARARIKAEAERTCNAVQPVNNRIAGMERLRQRMPFALLKRLVARISAAYCNAHQTELVQDRDARRALRAVDAFPASAYYLSSWFSLTGRPLSHKAADKSLSSWSLRCDLAGNAIAVQGADNRPTTRGVHAEWLVHNALDLGIRNGDLPSDMQLCTNIYLPNPHANEQERICYGSSFFGRGSSYLNSIKPLYTQIDCLAITRRAIYVLEVKSRGGDIRVNQNNSPARALPDGTTNSLMPAVQQCEAHASAFATMHPAIPFERIFELTVFANCNSFESPHADFKNNVLVSTCSDAHAPFIHAIARQEHALASKEPLFSLDEVQSMATTIRQRYGDINGKKERLHMERIALISTLRPRC